MVEEIKFLRVAGMVQQRATLSPKYAYTNLLQQIYFEENIIVTGTYVMRIFC